MNSWPKDTPEDLAKYFGKHELDHEGQPTERWESAFLTTLDVPYPMVLAWELETPVRRIRCHQIVRPSLSIILDAIWKLCGSLEMIKEMRMDRYGGCFNYRAARGLGRLSVHAWGAAIDLDPDANALGVEWKKNKGMMPMEVVEIFEKQGWQWGGRWKRPDCMHFQATQ